MGKSLTPLRGASRFRFRGKAQFADLLRYEAVDVVLFETLDPVGGNRVYEIFAVSFCYDSRVEYGNYAPVGRASNQPPHALSELDDCRRAGKAP